MAKKRLTKKARRQGKRLWIGRDKLKQKSYAFLAGAHPCCPETLGYWVANKADWRAERFGSRVCLCPSLFEKACPHLKLKPGEIVEIEVTKKEKSDG